MKGYFLFATSTSRPLLVPIWPPIQWVPRALSLGVKEPRHEADHSHSTPRLKMCGAIPPLPRLYGVVLKHRENFIRHSYIGWMAQNTNFNSIIYT
jgi:hypothetical protein